MRRLTWVWLGAVAALGASFVLTRDDADHGPVICPVRLVTGLPCPGCGLVRAFVACAHGDLGHAFALNLFAPVLFIALAVFVGWYGAELAARRSFGFVASVRRTRDLWYGVAAAWIGWGFVRFVEAALRA